MCTAASSASLTWRRTSACNVPAHCAPPCPRWRSSWCRMRSRVSRKTARASRHGLRAEPAVAPDRRPVSTGSLTWAWWSAPCPSRPSMSRRWRPCRPWPFCPPGTGWPAEGVCQWPISTAKRMVPLSAHSYVRYQIDDAFSAASRPAGGWLRRPARRSPARWWRRVQASRWCPLTAEPFAGRASGAPITAPRVTLTPSFSWPGAVQAGRGLCAALARRWAARD